MSTKLTRRIGAVVAYLAMSGAAWGQIDLDGLTLVEEGPAADAAGAPVPDNLSLSGTAFGSSELGPELGIDYHLIENLNDGFYGNGFSWIGASDNPFFDAFAGIDLGSTPVDNLQSIAFGRSNVLSGDPCAGICVDRHLGFYILQYTQVPNPGSDLDLNTSGNPATGWVDIGTLDYIGSEGEGTRFNRTWERHRYNFEPVSATGVRLIVPGTGLDGGTAIDEIELYNMPGDLVDPPDPPSPIMINNAAGYQITWDGNEADFFDEEVPPDGAIVPDNLALASEGSTPFSSSDLGPEIGVDFHLAENLNDGFYGNANSWIGGNTNPFAPDIFAGVAFEEATSIDRIAWGRDNGNDFTDACGGQCEDRSLGTYTIQFTQVDSPNEDTEATGDASTGWQSLGDVTYSSATEDFNPFWRHEFQVSSDTGPIMATGVRLLVSAAGTAIDEIEVYGGGDVSMPCDIDGDGVCTVADLNQLAAGIEAGETDSSYDLNADGTVDDADRLYWIGTLSGTWVGDSNLDGEFNSADIVAVFAVGKFETGSAAGWEEGDWNGDGTFNSSDIVAAFTEGGFEQGPRTASAVPEPSAIAMLFVAMLGLLRFRRA